VKQKNIESALQETRSFAPPPAFAARARVNSAQLADMRRRAAADHVGYWGALARESLHWHKPFTVTFDDSRAPNYTWFPDGELNVSWNCLDVHLATRGHKTAIIFEGEAGDVHRLSYRELHAQACMAMTASGIIGM
jgi:acetyl-CoA synthetase